MRRPGSSSAAAAVICGLGTALPDTLVANEEICTDLGVTADWISSRTGISHRARADRDVSTADLAAQAGARALESSGSTSVDVLVLATITPDHRCPAVAPEVAARLGLPGIPAFDLAAACTGLLYALQVAAGLLAAGTAQRVLVIAADRIPALIDPQDPVTAPLFGDGAAALVVRSGEREEPGALGPILLAADGRHAHVIVAPHGGFMSMQGRETFQRAVTCMSEVSEQAVRAAGWSLADLDRFVPHQANARITAAVGRRLGLDEPRVLQHIERVGNTSAASIPLTLAQASADGRLHPGHRVLMTAFGAGLTWGAATVVWPGLNPSIPPTGATTVNASLRAILVDELKLDPQALRAEARPEDAGLDSLALVELNMLLRDHCGVEIGEDVLSSATTVEALDRMVEQRLSRR